MPGFLTNEITLGSVFPTLGISTAELASPASGNGAKRTNSESTRNQEAEQAVAIGFSGNLVAWWIALAVMLFLLMFGSQRLVGDSEFKNIKPSVFNVLVISWAAIIGIAFWKAVFTRFKVPGLSGIVLST